ncbi:MAG: sorbosone dehydrogenase family protein [Acetobacteraceae bacterium]|nr:sorbosone dehydrogenase family protein [Acetobacteraceae bacterium]MBV8523780.1 sorbosone dehydrogenase family protein [Acetobacteraceae bacterium]
MRGWHEGLRVPIVAFAVFAGSLTPESSIPGLAQITRDTGGQILMGHAAYGDWHRDKPGLRRRITAADLPRPYATESASNASSVVEPPPGAEPKVPPGFTMHRFADGLENPRLVRVAPNGDIFIAETAAGRIRVMRAADGALQPDRNEVFASGLDAPFGIAFYPPGPDPRWVYVANTNSVVRFRYRSGDLRANSNAETVVAQLAETTGGHRTRDVAFSLDGNRMFISVGSASNAGEGSRWKLWRDRIPPWSEQQIHEWEKQHGLGAAWGPEANRADVLVFDPDGSHRRVFATGIRNCVGLAAHPQTGDLWCSTNERDGLGDDLPPDYVTRVQGGAFYGWPWYYIGSNEDPRHKGERPELAGRTTVPDVLIQPHSAPMQITFYRPPTAGTAAFPADYNGDAFVALHGSWNRARLTGYKIVRIRLHDGVPTGEYEDFATGFVIDDHNVWGRPVGVAVAHDGALLVTEDGNGTMWRIAYTDFARGKN